jgi:peptide-methionine (S)-S-oxide reductase
VENGAGPKLQTATFGAGCFWGVEELFRQVPGVAETAVGYMGGKLPKPTYEDVCTDRTGHAEVVQLKFDPAKVSYDKLLEAFWESHDPTTVNRQGPDIGSQYRSVVFYHNSDQKRAAELMRQELEESQRFPRKIVTEIEPASTFWRAEEYHQRYFEKKGGGTCRT